MHILVDHDAEEYVREIVRQADGEVGGIGYVEQLAPSEFFISEFVLLEQDAGHAHVDFEGDAYIKEITRAATDGREDQLRLSWHSHGSMDTYFSSTDDKGVEEYAALGMPWLISLVFNHARKTSSRIDIFDSSVCNQITISDMEYEVAISDTSIAKRVKDDLKRLVKDKKNSWDSWNKQAWDKSDDKSDDKSSDKSNEIVPMYPIGGVSLYQDDVEWSDEDYEKVATQLAYMGFDPKQVSEEELADIKEFMENNESTL